MIGKFVKCLMAPRLYKDYSKRNAEDIYMPNVLEKWSDKFIKTVSIIWSVGLYTSPFLCMYYLRRGLPSYEELKSWTVLAGGVTSSLFLAIVVRGLGRATNKEYTKFLEVLNMPKSDMNEYLKGIRKYDFEYTGWPVSYNVPQNNRDKSGMFSAFSRSAHNDLDFYLRFPLQLLSFIAVHTFALKLIYPGTLGIIHMTFDNALIYGRSQLIQKYDGQRAKIRTADGNNIDTLFIDKRMKSDKGGTLVICCEGNTGFYEVGIATTPAKCGYSVLGWNHPGFATSTGMPFPSQEQNAIDAVMQYALNELKFTPENIILFGWSIGAYAAAWASVEYPDIKGLIVDATFDDILPLAIRQMPQSWGPLVKEVVRVHVNLNISQLLHSYSGPIKIIRRTDDEIISLMPGVLATNRTNDVLVNLVKGRHSEMCNPDFLSSLREYVVLSDGQRSVLLTNNVVDQHMLNAVPLVQKYMKDCNIKHCDPLPTNVFNDCVLDLMAK